MEFCVLGGLDVRSASGPLALGGRKPRTVLALLLLYADTTVPVDRLVDALWPAGAPASAAKNVQTYVWALRRALDDGEPRIVTLRGGYRLVLHPGELDLREFERLSEQGRRLRPTDPELAGRRLREALALWRGPLLPDLDVDIADLTAEATRVDELHQATVEERIEADLALGRHTDLVAELAALVAAQPLRERLRGQQIRALYRSGRRADALAAFQDLRDRLDDELGIRPSPSLQRLYQAVLRSDAPGELDLPARVRTVPAQLPADTSEFTGRAEHLCQLDTAVLPGKDTPAVTVLTVVGSSGVGKTSLAVHWAHRVRHCFPDGQLYVNLRGHAPQPPISAGQALAQFLRALGVAGEHVPVTEDEAAGLYRSLLADRKMLVVLDDARSAEQVRPLLPGNPACAVLVTSRNRLAGLVARDGARPLALDVLTPAEAETLLRRLLGEQRVLREPSATAELARACGFLPLALRIAAAHLTTRPHQPLTDYLADLGRTDRLAALRVDGDPESAVSVAFDQSYQALDPGTRKLFRLLAFAPGADITVPAAAMLAGRPEHTTAVQLNRLVGVHMISEPSAARFTLHDLLRLYARQRADAEDGPDECAHAAGRLIHWYADMAAAAVAVLCPQFVRLPGTLPSRPFQESAAALAWLDAERANLVAAATTDGPPEAAWRLADALRGYFRLRRIGVDWLVTAQAGLAAAEAAEHPAGVAAARLSLADAYWSTGRHADAEEHYARALRSATDIGWVPGTAAVLTNLGTLHWELGRLEQATECYTAALARNREAGLVAGQAADLNNLGMVHRQLGRLTEAVDFHSRALHTHEAAGSRVGVGNALANLGVAYRLLGRLDDAVTKCTESLAVHREFGSRAAEAQIIGDLAEVHLLRGDPARAAAMLDEALGMQREIDHRRGEAATLYLLALTHRDRDDTEAALRHARAAAALAVDTGNTRSAALAMTLVASVEGRLGDETAALAGHAEALDVARSVRSHDAEADALIGWAETALRHSATDAHGYASAALALVSASGHRLLEARALTVLARIERTRGDETAAADYTQRALVIDRETGLSAGPFKAGRPSESAG